MLTILIVDDDEMIGNLFQIGLRKITANIHYCNNGEDALRLAMEVKPNVFFVDLLMPQSKLNGWDIIERLRASDEFRDVAIFAVTAGSPQDIDHARSLGATDVIRKPFRFDQIQAILEEQFANLEE